MRIPSPNPPPAATAGPAAFVDQMPELLARLDAPHGPDDWRARTPDGREVLARRLTVPEGERATIVERLHWVQEADSAGLLPILGAASNADGLWLLLQPVPGSPLGTVVAAGELTPAETAAIGLSLFHGLATLHRVGLGELVVLKTILLDTAGRAHLDGPWLPVDPGARGGQVRALGEALAGALGIGVRPDAGLTPAERQAPGLVATLRGISTGSAIDATTAGALLEEAAGALAAPPQVERSEGVIAERVRRLLVPGSTPVRRPGARVRRAPPAVGVAPPRPVHIGPRMSERSAWRAKPSPRQAAAGAVRASTVLVGALIGLALLVVVFGGATLITRHQQELAATPTPTPAAPKTTPTAAPPVAPQSAGAVASVELTADQLGNCSPGQSCQVEVKVNYSSGSHSAAWVFELTNLCTGQTSQIGSNSESTPYQEYVYADSTLTIPAGKAFQLVAKTTSPAVAASKPLAIGGNGC
ncbi:MAG: hypothetical protein ACREQM_08375 [Candidatus Dormibacteraceae bacterium]